MKKTIKRTMKSTMKSAIAILLLSILCMQLMACNDPVTDPWGSEAPVSLPGGKEISAPSSLWESYRLTQTEYFADNVISLSEARERYGALKKERDGQVVLYSRDSNYYYHITRIPQGKNYDKFVGMAFCRGDGQPRLERGTIIWEDKLMSEELDYPYFDQYITVICDFDCENPYWRFGKPRYAYNPIFTMHQTKLDGEPLLLSSFLNFHHPEDGWKEIGLIFKGDDGYYIRITGIDTEELNAKHYIFLEYEDRTAVLCSKFIETYYEK